jgi:hypothetical protein
MNTLAFALSFAIGAARAFAQDAPVDPAPGVEAQVPDDVAPVPEAPPTSSDEPIGAIPEPPAPPAGTMSSPSPEALALLDDTVYFEPDGGRRLNAWLAFNSDRNEIGRTVGGALIITLGALVVGAGVASLFAEDELLRDAFAISFGVLGFMSIGLGVGLIALTTPPEERFLRWRESAGDERVSDFELGRFEGEFLAEVETAKFNRTLSGVLGFAVAGAGAATAASASFFFVDDDEDAGLISLTVGLTFAIIGSVLGGLSFAIRSPIENDWERYRLGLAPTEQASPVF